MLNYFKKLRNKFIVIRKFDKRIFIVHKPLVYSVTKPFCTETYEIIKKK